MAPELINGEVSFHFHKSNFFRVIHVDGAFGGAAPNGSGINMSIYSERMPLPTIIAHPIDNGIIGPELAEKRVMKDGIFREVESSLFMTVETAAAMRDWLSTQIDELMRARAYVSSQGDK